MNLSPEKTEKPLKPDSEMKAEKVIRVGIVGAGLMGKWHAQAAKKSGGEIVAVADFDKEKAKLLAAKYPSAQSFAGAAEMFRGQSIDALHICTPTNTHLEIAELAVRAGANLFIEKPLAETARDTIYLYNLAAENNVKICPTHQFAFQQSVEKAKKMLPRVGETIHLRAVICSAGGAKLSAGKLDEIVAGILPHPLSLFQTFLNDTLIENTFDGFRPQNGELRASGQAGKTSLEIFVSLNARPTLNYFQITGSSGTIYLDLFHDFAFIEIGKVSKRQKILRPFDSSARNFSAAFFNLIRRAARFETAYPGLQNLINLFYAAIRDKAESPISPVQSINVAQIRDYLMRRAGEKIHNR